MLGWNRMLNLIDCTEMKISKIYLIIDSISKKWLSLDYGSKQKSYVLVQH